MKCPKCNGTKFVWYVLTANFSTVERKVGKCINCNYEITNKDTELYNYVKQKRKQC